MKRTFVALLALALTALSGAVATASDELIAKQIVDRLQHNRQSEKLQDFNIGVQVEDGTVTMMGNVASSAHAVLALDIARRIPGVKLVINDLYVQAQPAAAPAPTQTVAATPVAVPAENPAIQPPASAGVQPVVATAVTLPTPATPTLQPTAQAQPFGQQAIQPIAQQAIQPSGQQAAQPFGQQAAQPFGQQAAQPFGQQAAQPFGQQAAQPIARQPAPPVGQPMVVAPPRPQISGTTAGFVPQQARTGQPTGSGVTGPQPRSQSQTPLAFARSSPGNARPVSYVAPEYRQQQYPQQQYRQPQQAQYSSMAGMGPSPVPMGAAGGSVGTASYDNPQMPGYAWPSYAAYPNYGALTYPHQYSATAWPYIGPFYPYPQVPLGWRKVMLEWDDGWWFLDFKSK